MTRKLARRAVALDGLAREAQIEALDEPGDAVRVHLELVAGAELGQDLRLGLRDAAEVDELCEESLEAGRRDDLQESRWLIAGVPEGVPLVAGLEDQIAGAATSTSSPSSAPTRPSRT